MKTARLSILTFLLTGCAGGSLFTFNGPTAGQTADYLQNRVESQEAMRKNGELPPNIEGSRFYQDFRA